MSNPIALITGVGEGRRDGSSTLASFEGCVSRTERLSTQAAFDIALPCGVSSLCICSAVADGRLGIAIRCRFPIPFTSIKTSITPRRR